MPYAALGVRLGCISRRYKRARKRYQRFVHGLQRANNAQEAWQARYACPSARHDGQVAELHYPVRADRDGPRAAALARSPRAQSPALRRCAMLHRVSWLTARPRRQCLHPPAAAFATTVASRVRTHVLVSDFILRFLMPAMCVRLFGSARFINKTYRPGS